MGALTPSVATNVVSVLLPPSEASAALGSTVSGPSVVVVKMPAAVVSEAILAAVGSIGVLTMTGPGPMDSPEGAVMRTATVLVDAAIARLLAMLDMPMLRRDETLWMMPLALAGSTEASPLACDATAARMDDSRSATPRVVRLAVVMAVDASDGHT